MGENVAYSYNTAVQLKYQSKLILAKLRKAAKTHQREV
jgi:hypothetical protein